MITIKHLTEVFVGSKGDEDTTKEPSEKVSSGGNWGNNRNGDNDGNGHVKQLTQIDRHRRMLVIQEVGKDVYDFIRNQVTVSTSETLILSTTSLFNILNQDRADFQNIVNLRRINDVRRINKFFEAANAKLVDGGCYVGSVDTYWLRKRLILRKTFPPINYIHYFLFFLIKRVMPKLQVTKRIYFFFSRGNDRVLSRAETFGRLYSCGFEVINEQEINERLYYVAQKRGKPAYDYSPTYGPLVKLRRVGKNKKIIYVFKMRTMHPYSEYIQEYLYDRNGTKDGDKIINDFRITTWGKIARKLWFDELPMLINWFKGDLKLVGVRPLSIHKFSIYPEWLQSKRTSTKPGLVPPYYADMPKTQEEFFKSENKYIEAYLRHPFLTDWKYFWKAFYNIVFRNARSG